MPKKAVLRSQVKSPVQSLQGSSAPFSRPKGRPAGRKKFSLQTRTCKTQKKMDSQYREVVAIRSARASA